MMLFARISRALVSGALLFSLMCGVARAQAAAPLPRFDGDRALAYTREFVATGPRWVGSPGHAKAEAFLQRQFAKDDLVKDSFTASTPAGPMALTNYIVKFPGNKDGIIVLASHYDTNYPLKDTDYVGANDGGSSTGLLLALANSFRGKKLDGYSVWLVFFDGEEAFKGWTDADSAYGSRHLAAKWQADGTLKRIKAFLLADMIGDRDLDVDRDLNSTKWLLDLVGEAAAKFGDQSYFFQRENQVGDDHTPFMQRGVPCADIIDFDYGYQNSFWHTPQDTMDKLSAKSLTIVGDVFLETIRLLNQR
jgi:Zn-dependent M28 family amino/carboxypeptidase